MVKFLEILCRENGVSGGEGLVLSLIEERLSGSGCDVFYDRMGNLVAKKAGAKRPKMPVTLFAHADEVGLIISRITEDGFLKFKTVGGIDPRTLPGRAVFIGKDRVRGVIGVGAVHLLTKEQRGTAPSIDKLYIDIGAKDSKDAGGAVNLGDLAAFDDAFVRFGGGLICSKALDDRAGCAVITEIMSKDLEYDLCAVITVQEEIGTRGAHVGASHAAGGCGIVVETTTCADFDGVPKAKNVTRLNFGPAVSFMDSASFYNPRLFKLTLDVAAKEGIRHQIKQSSAGGNDAGVIITSGGGTMVQTISMPCRYLHSPSSVISIEDLNNTARLAAGMIKRLGDEGFDG